MDEILKTATEIIFTCAMGEDISSWEIDFWENGKCSKRDATFVMRHNRTIFRARCPTSYYFVPKPWQRTHPAL
jgi:hypothetical protein